MQLLQIYGYVYHSRSRQVQRHLRSMYTCEIYAAKTIVPSSVMYVCLYEYNIISYASVCVILFSSWTLWYIDYLTRLSLTGLFVVSILNYIEVLSRTVRVVRIL